MREWKERSEVRKGGKRRKSHPPVHVLEAALLGAGYTTEQHDDRVGLGWDEPQQEGVPAATVVTLEHRLTKRTVSMETDLLALGADQVVDDVTRGGREGGRQGGREGRREVGEGRKGGEGRDGGEGGEGEREGREGGREGREGERGRRKDRWGAQLT